MGKEKIIIKRKYIVTAAITTILIFIVVIGFYLFSVNKISDIYMGKTKEIIFQLKEDFMKDTVNNMISQIDIERKSKVLRAEKMVNNTAAFLRLNMELTDEEFQDIFTDYFKKTEYKEWLILLWNQEENKAVYDSHGRALDSFEETTKSLIPELAAYRIIEHGTESALYGIRKSYTDELAKEAIADKIRSSKFREESYIWVNEIINYQGGEHYAIRRIHPNLPETEGMYLSTNMTDEKGNFPYRMELEGINKEGELFFTYYFKKLNSDVVSEKLTYAKLYKDFNWVIGMGIHLDDLKEYTDKANEESKVLASRLIAAQVLVFIVILAFSFGLVILVEKLYFQKTRKLLETEINQDTLTMAWSRKMGTGSLSRAFKDYKRKGLNPCVMIFDVDYFKTINDTYGHAVGDKVLVEIVQCVQRLIRSSDQLIRWGGDEFVIIFYGLYQENAYNVGRKIISEVSALKIPGGKDGITPSLSIGFSFFKESDIDYMDVLSRADQALYQSKSNGRNQVSRQG